MAHNPRTHWEPGMPRVTHVKEGAIIKETHTIVRVVAPITEGNDTGFRYARQEDLDDSGDEYTLYEGPEYSEPVEEVKAKPTKGGKKAEAGAWGGEASS